MQRFGSAASVARYLSGARADSRFPPDAAVLHEAVWGLAARTPELSAATGLWPWQKVALAGLAAAIGCVLLGGALLFHYLKQRTALIDCLSSGRRNCDQVIEPSDR